MDAAQLSPGESVLEVGCGTGVLSRLLAQRTHGESHITGMDINPYFLNEAAALVRREGLDNSIEFREGNAEALPFADNSFDVTMSITVIEEVDASKLIADMVRVTKPGGRIAVASRALDLPCISNLPLSPEIKAKVDVPGILGTCVELGCADASLYQRLHQAGVFQVKMFPHLAAFDGSAKVVLQLMQDSVLRQLNREEAAEWRKARAEAEADGTFFMAWPHHCAVGTKP